MAVFSRTFLRKKVAGQGRSTSHLVTVHGSAAKHWLHRGEDECGSGWRKAAKKWPIGESLKQNACLRPTGGHRERAVSSICHSLYYAFLYTSLVVTVQYHLDELDKEPH